CDARSIAFHATRDGARPPGSRPAPGRDELVDEAPELAIEIDVPIGPADEVEPAVGTEAGPDASTRQVERDRQADDQRGEGGPDDRLARVALGDEEGVVGEATQRDREPESFEVLGFAADERGGE